MKLKLRLKKITGSKNYYNNNYNSLCNIYYDYNFLKNKIKQRKLELELLENKFFEYKKFDIEKIENTIMFFNQEDLNYIYNSN